MRARRGGRNTCKRRIKAVRERGAMHAVLRIRPVRPPAHHHLLLVQRLKPRGELGALHAPVVQADGRRVKVD